MEIRKEEVLGAKNVQELVPQRFLVPVGQSLEMIHLVQT